MDGATFKVNQDNSVRTTRNRSLSEACAWLAVGRLRCLSGLANLPRKGRLETDRAEVAVGIDSFVPDGEVNRPVQPTPALLGTPHNQIRRPQSLASRTQLGSLRKSKGIQRGKAALI